MEKTHTVDENLYSRQIGAFGMETMSKLVKMRVLIIGLGGLGVETAKNLILAGPNSVTLWDKQISNSEHQGANFYITDQHVQNANTRAEASIGQLKQLNPYVSVSLNTAATLNQLATQTALEKFDIVVITDLYEFNTLSKINSLCRDADKGFIFAACPGLLGWTFVDFGKEHVVFDKNGEDCKSILVSNITRDGVVTTQEDKRHDLEDGDLVKFKEVVGMESLNGQTFKVKVLTPFTLEIENLASAIKEGETYIRNGIIDEIKEKIKPDFKSLEESLQTMNTKEFDMEPDLNFDSFFRLIQTKYLLSKALVDQAKFIGNGVDYQGRNVEANVEEIRAELEPEPQPEPIQEETTENTAAQEPSQPIEEESAEPAKTENTEEPSQKIEEEEEEKKDDFPEWKKKIDTKLLKYILAFWNLEIAPITAFWGGIVAQEVVKLTGKYSPIDQWLIHEFYSASFKHLQQTDVLQNLQTKVSGRYASQTLLLGPDIQSRIQNSKIMMVGAGALGCEYLKLFAMMGLCAGPQGQLSVTDDDTIEISNLNRQFLFRKRHVGSSKSETAIQQVKAMNPQLNAKAYTLRVEPNTENTFNDEFFDQQTYLVNAVDNIKARMYVDGKALLHKKWLFEAGTLGTKCNGQIIRPNDTESYADSSDPEEKHIPMCTLRNFPFLIEHCIEWSRDQFFSVFSTASQQLKKLQSDKATYFADLKKEAKSDAVTVSEKIIGLKAILQLSTNPSVPEMVFFARDQFQLHFCDKISKLLKLFPADYVDKEGNVFWSSPKRAPNAATFNPASNAHRGYIKAILNILGQVFPSVDTSQLKDSHLDKILSGYIVQETAVGNEEEERKKALNKKQEEDASQDLSKSIADIQTIAAKLDPALTIEEVEFEKDQDANGHIDFISISANLRAANYSIENAPRHRIKMIAGKIIPAIATTTAMVVGAMGVELFKFYLGCPTPNLRNFFSNLGISMLNFSEPMPPVVAQDKEYDEILLGPVKAMPPKWNTWSRIEVQGKGMLLKDLLTELNTRFDIEMEGVTLGKVMVWNSYGGGYDERELSIEEIFEKHVGQLYPGKRYVVMSVSAMDKNMIDLNMPYVVYQIQE